MTFLCLLLILYKLNGFFCLFIISLQRCVFINKSQHSRLFMHDNIQLFKWTEQVLVHAYFNQAFLFLVYSHVFLSLHWTRLSGLAPQDYWSFSTIFICVFSRVQLVRDHCGLKIISHIVHLCAEKTQLEWGWV